MAGYLQRTKALVTLTQTTGGAPPNTCGYVIWAPRYFSRGLGTSSDIGSTARSQMNLFVWQAASADLSPSNATEAYSSVLNTNPPIFGLQRSTTSPWSSTKALPDPAASFVGGTVCEDARLLSSCIRVTYTGRQSDSAGIICPIRNISLADFLVRSDLTAGTQFYDKGLSVSDIFRLSAQQTRLGTETHEIRSRDSDNELDEWQTVYDPAAYPGTYSSTSVTISTMDPGVSPREPNVIGFAWQNIEPEQFTKLYIELYKNFEWRPQSDAGISVPTEERISTVSNVPKTMQYLDRIKHGWDIARPYVSAAAGAAATLQALVYGGTALRIGAGIAASRMPPRRLNF